MKTSAILASAALVLGACQQSDPGVCSSLAMKFPNVSPQSADDQRQVLYSCMERWAARLARSDDAAPYVARAAVAACEDALAYYADWLEREGTPPNKEVTREFWIERTMFIAVQTRAGNCHKDA